MIETQPAQTTILLDRIKSLLTVVVFGVGYIIYYLTEGQHGFVPELLHHIGLFLAAVVAVHLIYNLLIKKDEQSAMRREISNAVTTTLSAFMPAFEKWGFQGFDETLNYKVIFEKLRAGDELLWLDTYAPARAEVIDYITAALAKGAKIQMLVIAPESNTAKLRAKEIQQPGFTEQTFLNDLSSFINELRVIVTKTQSLEVRLYNDLPCVPMYIHRRGGIPISGFTSYFLSHASERFAHARWGFADDGMLKHFTEYFDKKWILAESQKLTG